MGRGTSEKDGGKKEEKSGHARGGEAVPVFDNTDLFFKPVEMEEGWLRTYPRQFLPTGSPDGNRLTFVIQATTPGHYMELGEAYVAMELELVDKDGNPPSDSDHVAPINSFATSLFKDITLTIQSTPCSLGYAGMYPLVNHVNNVLSVGSDRKKGWDQFQGYYPDTMKDVPNSAAQAYAAPGELSSFDLRRDQFGTYSSADRSTFKYQKTGRLWFAPLLSDFSNCSKPMIPGVGGTVDLFRSDDAFVVQNGKIALANKAQNEAFKNKGFRIKINTAELVIPTKEMLSSLNLHIESMLAKQPVMYHTIRQEVKKIALEKGMRAHVITTIKNPQQRVLPIRIFVFVVTEYNTNSLYGRNPFTFSATVAPDPESKDELFRLPPSRRTGSTCQSYRDRSRSWERRGRNERGTSRSSSNNSSYHNRSHQRRRRCSSATSGSDSSEERTRARRARSHTKSSSSRSRSRSRSRSHSSSNSSNRSYSSSNRCIPSEHESDGSQRSSWQRSEYDSSSSRDSCYNRRGNSSNSSSSSRTDRRTTGRRRPAYGHSQKQQHQHQPVGDDPSPSPPAPLPPAKMIQARLTIDGVSVEAMNTSAETGRLYPRKMRELYQTLGLQQVETGLEMKYHLYTCTYLKKIGMHR